MSGRDAMQKKLRGAVAAVIMGWLIGPAAAGDAAAVVTPREKITLYDGKTVADLRHFTTWLADHGQADPNRVYTVVDVVDGAPAIRISVAPVHGAPWRRIRSPPPDGTGPLVPRPAQ